MTNAPVSYHVTKEIDRNHCKDCGAYNVVCALSNGEKPVLKTVKVIMTPLNPYGTCVYFTQR